MIDMQWYQVVGNCRLFVPKSQNMKSYWIFMQLCTTDCYNKNWCDPTITTVKNFIFWFEFFWFTVYQVVIDRCLQDLCTHIHNFKGIAGISFTGKDNSMYSKEPCSLPQNLGLMLTMGSSLLYCDCKVQLKTVSHGDITNNRKGLYSFDMHECSVLWVLGRGGWVLL